MATATMEFVASLRSRVQNIAETGEVEISEWAETHKFLIRLFEHTILNEFPFPKQKASVSDSATDLNNSTTSQPSPGDKTPFAEHSPESTTPTDEEQTSQSLTTARSPDPTKSWREILPLEAVERCEWIYTCLTGSFADHPPCTVQRLAELFLAPKLHYRYLLPYLNAVDRLVSISPPHLIFPVGLSRGQPLSSRFAHLQDTHSGAHLEPISWLEPGHSQSGSDVGSSFHDERIGGLDDMSDVDPQVVGAIDFEPNEETADSEPLLDQETTTITTQLAIMGSTEDSRLLDSILPHAPSATSSLTNPSSRSPFSESQRSASPTSSDAGHPLHSDDVVAPTITERFDSSVQKKNRDSPTVSIPDSAGSSVSNSPPPTRRESTQKKEELLIVSSTNSAPSPSKDNSNSVSSPSDKDDMLSPASDVPNKNRKRPALSSLDNDPSSSPRTKARLSSPTEQVSPSDTRTALSPLQTTTTSSTLSDVARPEGEDQKEAVVVDRISRSPTKVGKTITSKSHGATSGKGSPKPVSTLAPVKSTKDSKIKVSDKEDETPKTKKGTHDNTLPTPTPAPTSTPPSPSSSSSATTGSQPSQPVIERDEDDAAVATAEVKVKADDATKISGSEG